MFLTSIVACIVLKNFNITNIVKYFVFCSLIVIAFVDLKIMIIPDTLIILNIGLIIGYFIFYKQAIFGVYSFMSKEIMYALVLNFLLLLVVILFQVFYKKEIMGYGDIKLLLVFGLMMGVTKLLLIIFISSFIAVIIELPQNKRKKQGFSFGPYLVLAFGIVYLFGDLIINILF